MIYHISKEFCEERIEMDYLGIVVHIWGSLFTWLYFGCHGNVRLFYMISITGLAIVVAITTTFPKFCITKLWQNFSSNPETACRWFRTTVFTIYTVAIALPLSHQYYLQNQRNATIYMIDDVNFYNFLRAYSIWATGLLIYIARVPERLMPGFFNIWGHSHQIMHIVMMLGDYEYYNGIVHLAKACNRRKMIKPRFLYL